MNNQETKGLILAIEGLTKAVNVLSAAMNHNNPNLFLISDPVKPITIEDWIEKDLDLNKNNLAASSLRSIKTAYEYFVEFFGNDRIIDSISKEDIVEYIAFLYTKINNRVYFDTIKGSLNRAVEYGYLRTNYFNSLKPPKRQNKKPVSIPREQLFFLLTHVKNSVLRDLILLTYLMGFRCGEISNMTFRSIDFIEMVIRIGNSDFTTKTRHQRVIPFDEQVLEILERNKPKIIDINKKQYLFRKKDGSRFTEDYISKSFKKAVRAAKLNEEYTFHSLRHSFASNLARAGVGTNAIKELLGHTSITTTQLYVHENLDSLRESVSKINNREYLAKVNIDNSK